MHTARALSDEPVKAAAPAPLLELSGLTRRFGERAALSDLSLSVYPGEVVGVLGPNGAGKSTAFGLLSGLLRPDAGEVRFRGAPLSLNDAALRRELGVVFQRNSLDGALTARENLRLGARLFALPPKLARARVDAMLELIELKGRADEKVAGWSGGMRRRLELARALVHGPKLLLMDEPTQGLDEASFRKLWAHLAALQEEQGLTVLLTTHRPEEAQLCDRLAVLDQGRLVACESPAALIASMGGDIVVLEAEVPELVAERVSAAFGLPVRVNQREVLVEHPQGHTLIPRLVEVLPRSALRSVSLRRPTLADVFLKLTGHALGADLPAEQPVKKRRA